MFRFGSWSFGLHFPKTKFRNLNIVFVGQYSAQYSAQMWGGSICLKCDPITLTIRFVRINQTMYAHMKQIWMSISTLECLKSSNQNLQTIMFTKFTFSNQNLQIVMFTKFTFFIQFKKCNNEPQLKGELQWLLHTLCPVPAVLSPVWFFCL